MTELTERERKIVYITNFMHNPPKHYAQLPVEMRENLMKIALNLVNIKYDKDEFLDISRAMTEEGKRITEAGVKFLFKHKDAMKGLGDFKFD